MIGKRIMRQELQEVLSRERKREEDKEQFENELKGIKPGECLLYEVEKGMGNIAKLSFSLLIEKIGGLKMITEDDRIYIYKEERKYEN